MNLNFRKEDSLINKLDKEYAYYFLLNIIILFICILDMNLYTAIVNLFRISLLWIFICVIHYKESLENKNFLIIMEITSLFFIILGCLSMAKVKGSKIEFFNINFIIMNICNFIFIKNIADEIIKKKKLVYIYIVSISIYLVFLYIIGEKGGNFLFILLNIGMSINNIVLIDKCNLKKIKYYKMIKNLSKITLFSACVGFIYFIFYYKYNKSNFYGLLYLTLLNYIYYLYRYTMKYIVKNPYYKLKNKNNELSNKSYSLNNINKTIERGISTNKKINDNIHYRKDLLNQSLEVMPNIWIIADYNFNILYSNSNFKNKFGDNFKTFYQVISSTNTDSKLFNKILENKNKEFIISENIKLGDSIYTINITNNFIDNTFLICLTDITKEIKLERYLKNIGEEYKAIIENIPCAIMIRNSSDIIEDININMVNKYFEELFDSNNEDLMNMNILKYYNKFNIEFLDNKTYYKLNLNIDEKIKNIQNNANKYNLITATMKDNKDIRKNIEIKVDDFEDEGKIYKLIILKDITEEVNTYKNINRQNNMYEKVLNNIPYGLIIENSNSKNIIYANQKYMDIFGIYDKEINKLSYKYRDRINTKYLYNLKKGKKDKSIYILNNNNKIKELKVHTRSLYMNNEKIKIKIIKDLNQQREAERMKEMLISQREYDKMKMEFYANISHELKTPLNNIYSSLQLIENLYKNNKIKEDNKEISNHIKTTKQNMFRLIRLIDNIINISQVKSDIYKIKSVNFDIVYLIEEIVDSLIPYAKLKEINLTFDTNEEEILVGLDPETIERIILNLLSNSIKFTKQGGKIFIGVYKENQILNIIVKDTGIGIDKSKLIEIFDRFKQIENGSISNEFGSGIGLYLSKSLVEFQNGTIDINSEINKGTDITIKFPILRVKEKEDTLVEYKQNIEKFKIEFFDIYRS